MNKDAFIASLKSWKEGWPEHPTIKQIVDHIETKLEKDAVISHEDVEKVKTLIVDAIFDIADHTKLLDREVLEEISQAALKRIKPQQT